MLHPAATRLSQVTGLGLLAATLALILLAQAQMGASWRIGVDRQRRTELVYHGLFARSRNPIFGAMQLALVGLLLCVPSALALCCLRGTCADADPGEARGDALGGAPRGALPTLPRARSTVGLSSWDTLTTTWATLTHTTRSVVALGPSARSRWR